MSTVKSKKLQVGTDASASNNFTIYQPATPDGTLRIGVGNADSPTEVGRFTSAGYKPATAPAFSAYKNVNQSITNSTITKITFEVEDFDTNNNFDNSRFTPTVAGYYMISGYFNGGSGTAPNRCACYIHKNGTLDRILFDTSARNDASGGATLIYLNGSTDYVEIYGYVNTTSPAIYGNRISTFFTGHLVQQA